MTVLAAAAIALAGCSSNASGASSNSSTTGGTSGGKGASSVAKLLPSDVRSAGELTVGINAIFAPMEFVDPGSTTPKGFDIDVAKAIGKELGIRIAFANQQFDQLIPSLSTGRVDMVLSGISDTAQREQTVSFIDYFKTGTQVYVQKSDSGSVKSLGDLCGKAVAISASTDYVTNVADWSKKNCQGAGKSAITILSVDSEPSARLQMSQGRAVGSAIGPEVLAYLNQTDGGKYVAVGPILNPSPYGIGFKKSDTQLRDAVLAALKQVKASGEYDTLLQKWGLTSNAVGSFTVDHPTL